MFYNVNLEPLYKMHCCTQYKAVFILYNVSCKFINVNDKSSAQNQHVYTFYK